VARRVNINGQIFPPEEAHIAVFDHGFLYGDGVYETLRTYGGVPFLLDAHLGRLRRSASRLSIDLEKMPVDPKAELARTIRASGNAESMIRLVITRGTGPFGYSPSLCPHPNFLAFVQEFEPAPESAYRDGISMAVVSVRRNPQAALDPHIKSINLLNNILAAIEAKSRGVDEGILLNLSGRVAESSMSNIFIVSAGRVLTPPVSAGILDGLTRDFLLGVCRAAGIPAAEEDLTPEDLTRAEECFLTSTTREVLPVTTIDGRAIGSGAPGPLTRRLMTLFHEKALEAMARADS
jgi:branched-chain amino acid aminotransferase